MDENFQGQVDVFGGCWVKLRKFWNFYYFSFVFGAITKHLTRLLSMLDDDLETQVKIFILPTGNQKKKFMNVSD